MARAIEHRQDGIQVAEAFPMVEGNMGIPAMVSNTRPAVSKTLWTHVHILSERGRSPPCPVVVQGRKGKARCAIAGDVRGGEFR